MANGGLSIRIFRLSSLRCDDEYDEDGQQAKEDNIARYAERVKAGLPVFGTVNSAGAGGNGDNAYNRRK